MVYHLVLRRAPRGARGLKYGLRDGIPLSPSRAPRGARGLKFNPCNSSNEDKESRPSRGAWIEMPVKVLYGGKYESRPSRGAWIEMLWSVQ